MLPIVALVGRPNVGKSTLFNTLTGTRDAIVADVPGVTRDRQYGYAREVRCPAWWSTPAASSASPHPRVEQQMRVQTERAIAEADRLILVVDGRAGLTTEDQYVARLLLAPASPWCWPSTRPKGCDPGVVAADFHRLGLGAPHAIAAVHGNGCEALLDAALAGLEPDSAPQTNCRTIPSASP